MVKLKHAKGKKKTHQNKNTTSENAFRLITKDTSALWKVYSQSSC